MLWIDDELTPSSVEVRFLELQGFRVHCAVTAKAGLAMARTSGYRAIVLDLRLPDMSGLVVLATLRAEEINTPVLVLTGFGDYESALVAARLGVNAYEAKPLFVEELYAAVQRIIREGPASNAGIGGTVDKPLADNLRPGFSSIAHLLEQLQRVSPEKVSPSEYRHDELRSTVVATLIRSLANPALPMSVFLACAESLRHAVAADSSESPFTLATNAETRILSALGRSEPSNAGVRTAIGLLRSGTAQHKRLRLEDVATSMPERVSAERLGTLIKEQTGVWFTDWRTAFLLRPSVSLLLNTHEDVKQIARSLLGFTNVSQFDDEFRRIFGVSPTGLRQLWRARRQ